mmetsp:Transcript_20607/g.66815  ORF Transcript_20607/g.66815 Transcript_20607/m.66815 type:complete len:187 (+) Transcript_20607:3-563(+)
MMRMRAVCLFAALAAVGAIPELQPAPENLLGETCAEGGLCPTGPSCRVCGNYCGAGWCGGECVDETVCDTENGVPAQGCTDRCCQLHDSCCGCYQFEEDCDLTHCNSDMVECLAACPSEPDCAGGDGLLYSANLLETVFFLLDNACCGVECVDFQKREPSSLQKVFEIIANVELARQKERAAANDL